MIPAIPDIGRDFTVTDKMRVQLAKKQQWLKWSHSPDFEQEAA
jgi:hypothetical protein